jgi:8-amino-7-oxononanoate synthase
MSSVQQQMQEALSQHEQSGLLRTMQRYDHYIDFCSNDYLGILRDGLLTQGIEDILKQWSVPSYGTGGSRLIYGHHEYHEALENRLAQHHGAEKALVFDNGYMANHGLITALGTKETTLLLDAHCHASLLVSAHQSNARQVWKFAHNDLRQLEQKLQKASKPALVLIESVYSMDGDEAAIPEIIQLCHQHGAQLVIDHAHSFGWHNYEKAIPTISDPHHTLLAQVFTYGKAGGCHGASIVGSQLLSDYLINFSRPFIYSTAPTPYHAAAIWAMYNVLPTLDDRRKKLMQNIEHWNRGQCETSHRTPIRIFKSPDSREFTRGLNDAGFGVKAILPPTVAAVDTCLRVCLHAFNTTEEISQLQKLLHIA